MVIEGWLVFKISKYGHKTLWLVFKIFKHRPRVLWSPARCINTLIKLFIALKIYPKVFTEFAPFVIQAKD